MRHVVLAGLVTIAGCAAAGVGVEPMTQRVASDLWLRVGEEVRVDGTALRLVLEGVPADSRCASDVVCIWMGDASVALVLSLGMRAPVADTLHTYGFPRRESIVGPYQVRLEDVRPYPRSGTPTPPDGYTVRLKVTNLPD